MLRLQQPIRRRAEMLPNLRSKLAAAKQMRQAPDLTHFVVCLVVGSNTLQLQICNLEQFALKDKEEGQPNVKLQMPGKSKIPRPILDLAKKMTAWADELANPIVESIRNSPVYSYKDGQGNIAAVAITQCAKPEQQVPVHASLDISIFVDAVRTNFSRERLRCLQCDKKGMTRSMPQITKLKLCSGCHIAPYCSAECQKLHWPTHKAVCKEIPTAFPVAPGHENLIQKRAEARSAVRESKQQIKAKLGK